MGNYFKIEVKDNGIVFDSYTNMEGWSKKQFEEIILEVDKIKNEINLQLRKSELSKY